MKQNEGKTDGIPMYQMNPTSLFSGRGTDYAKYRPGYPREAIATILQGLDHLPQPVAADIGAGTGIASRMLADCGVRVIAIEPNADMRLAASPHPLVEFREGKAEVTHLPDASVDLITCFQSFHWFDPVPTLSEFRRILKSSGRLAVVWGIWDEDDAFTKELSDLVTQASSNRLGLPSSESRVSALLESPLFHHVRSTSFTYQQQLDLQGLIGDPESRKFTDFL